MNLFKYYSAHIFSFVGYILLCMIISFVFGPMPDDKDAVISDTLRPGTILLTMILLPVLLQFIECSIRRQKPNFLPKVMRFKCKFFRYVQYFIFAFGYFFGLLGLGGVLMYVFMSLKNYVPSLG